MGGGGYDGGDAAYWQQLMATITQAAQARLHGFESAAEASGFQLSGYSF